MACEAAGFGESWPQSIAARTPAACVLRETREETGLILPEDRLSWSRAYVGPRGITWFFAAHLEAGAAGHVRLGDEGQGWALMTWQAYCAHDRAIPHFAARLAQYVGETDPLP